MTTDGAEDERPVYLHFPRSQKWANKLIVYKGEDELAMEIKINNFSFQDAMITQSGKDLFVFKS